MAKTSGHGNPHWNRDETILALSLYLTLDGKMPDARDPRVVELSQLLRKSPIHRGAAEANPTFRNPDGVAFKLLNLHHVATGKGLDSTSRTDKAVWDEFGKRRDEVDRLATFIRAKINEHESDEGPPEPADDVEFAEGGLATREHKVRERSRKLRSQVLKPLIRSGHLCCEACACKPPTAPIGLEDAIYEVHHLIPLAQTGAKRTRVSDVAVLCANCHRLLHRLIAHHRRWIGLQELRTVLGL